MDSIIRKAYIDVSQKGTKAAASAMGVVAVGCLPDMDYEVVHLSRPFLYAIVHNETGLPVFVGALNRVLNGE